MVKSEGLVSWHVNTGSLADFVDNELEVASSGRIASNGEPPFIAFMTRPGHGSRLSAAETRKFDLT